MATWFNESGSTYRLAKYSRYGTDMRIRAVSTDGKFWDVLGSFSSLDHVYDQPESDRLEALHADTVDAAEAWAVKIGDVR